MTALGSAVPLAPTSLSLGTFDVDETIRGGSTAYTLLTAGATRPATAIKVRNSSGQVLGTSMRPQLWVVRVQ